MNKRKLNENQKEGGIGKRAASEYKPYITTSEFNSNGTTSVVKDWKTGRGVHCLSQGEAILFYILRWDDNNVDIREQFPLDYDETVKIASQMGFLQPKAVMTTDMLVTLADGNLIAYSVKADRNLNKRQLQLLCVEKQYWLNRNVECRIVFKTDMNSTLASNIRLVTEFYDPALVFDVVSAIKHKIAIKEIRLDMSSKPLDNSILKKLLEVNNE